MNIDPIYTRQVIFYVITVHEVYALCHSLTTEGAFFNSNFKNHIFLNRIWQTFYLRRHFYINLQLVKLN